MRILIITTQDRFFLSHIRERASYFKEQGCVIGIAAQKTSDELIKKIRSLGFDFFDTKIERQSVNPISQIIAIFRLFKIQTRFKPDISYHLGAKAIFYGAFAARLFNSRVGIINAPIGLGYVFASSTLKARLLRPPVLLLYKYFLNPKKSRVIVENIDDINYFVKKGYLNPKDAFCILGAGVNTNKFSPQPFGQRNSIYTVVMASRLIREKGVLDFVSAATKLYQMGIPVKMQLIGEPDFGNPSSITNEEFEEIKRNPAIECLGYQPNVIPFFQMAHICCLPSFYREGLPRVLVEAASTGLAILTTDTVGCKETIREENGFLFHAHDVDRLCKYIIYLVEHPKELEKMCNRSRDVALKYFDTKLISQRTFEIILSLFGDHH